MLRISGTTSLTSREIVSRAAMFFGRRGLGLQEKVRSPCCIEFEGGGGHVVIRVIEDGKKRSVEIETMEWETQAKKFLEMN